MIDIELITEISEEVFSGHAEVLVMASKTVAALIFLVATAQKFMKSYATSGSVEMGKKDGLGPYDILRILFVLVLIVFIPEILQLIDRILNGILELFLLDFGSELTALEMEDIPMTANTGDNSTLDSILTVLMQINANLSPVAWLNNSIINFAYYIDILIFLMFLGKRFFILGVIKILSPLMVAFAVFPKYHDLIYNIGKVYTRTFITIIPLLLVNVFANQFYKMFMEYMTDSVGGAVTMATVGQTIKCLAIIGFIWLKFKLYKQSTEIVNSLWA